MISVIAACVLYTLQHSTDPASFLAPPAAVAAILTTLAALHCGMTLTVVALGPTDLTVSADEAITAGASALTALTVAALVRARIRVSRAANEPVTCRPSPASHP